MMDDVVDWAYGGDIEFFLRNRSCDLCMKNSKDYKWHFDFQSTYQDGFDVCNECWEKMTSGVNTREMKDPDKLRTLITIAFLFFSDVGEEIPNMSKVAKHLFTLRPKTQLVIKPAKIR